jgi:hypothetical protein
MNLPLIAAMKMINHRGHGGYSNFGFRQGPVEALACESSLCVPCVSVVKIAVMSTRVNTCSG